MKILRSYCLREYHPPGCYKIGFCMDSMRKAGYKVYEITHLISQSTLKSKQKIENDKRTGQKDWGSWSATLHPLINYCSPVSYINLHKEIIMKSTRPKTMNAFYKMKSKQPHLMSKVCDMHWHKTCFMMMEATFINLQGEHILKLTKFLRNYASEMIMWKISTM